MFPYICTKFHHKKSYQCEIEIVGKFFLKSNSLRMAVDESGQDCQMCFPDLVFLGSTPFEWKRRRFFCANISVELCGFSVSLRVTILLHGDTQRRHREPQRYYCRSLGAISLKLQPQTDIIRKKPIYFTVDSDRKNVMELQAVPSVSKPVETKLHGWFYDESAFFVQLFY